MQPMILALKRQTEGGAVYAPNCSSYLYSASLKLVYKR